MIFKVINNKAYQILDESISLSLKNGSQDPIAIDNQSGQIILLRSYSGGHANNLTIDDIRSEISKMDSKNWRSEERKRITINYYKDVLNLMTKYQRELTIDEVLRPYSYYDYICQAC